MCHSLDEPAVGNRCVSFACAQRVQHCGLLGWQVLARSIVASLATIVYLPRLSMIMTHHVVMHRIVCLCQCLIHPRHQCDVWMGGLTV